MEGNENKLVIISQKMAYYKIFCEGKPSPLNMS